ncbi:MAG: hypothetical protein JWQ57_1051 [Mucilaginibacter sp.]|nr:hypothetical protein [Mucilaginibacter sp.]
MFPQGDQGSADYFAGTAWVKILVPKDETGTYSIGNVVFEAGCRNNWHTHAHGQILLVTDGKGFYQERGKAARQLAKGDVVVIPSNVEHWHGAAHDSSFTHIVVTNNSAEGPVKWLDRVTDEEYNSLKTEGLEQVNLKISETALRNHEQLLPKHQSKLQKTDPEFIALFDNFAFDEVIAHDDLDVKMRVMMILASTIGSNALTEYKVMVGGALNVGVTPVAIKEVLYQAVPYVGIAKGLDFLLATNEVLLKRGVTLPLEEQSTTTPETRYDKGLRIQKSIFGEAIDKMYQDAPEDQKHFQKYLSDNCFGDYYTRTGLDIKTRELVTFSVLIALGGVEPQVKGYVQGNLNVGNNRQTLINVTTQLLPYIGYPRTLNAIKCINEVTAQGS